MGYPSALTATRWGFQDVLLGGRRVTLERPLGSYVMDNVLFKVALPAEFHAQTAAEAAVALHPLVRGRVDEIARIEIWTQEPALRIIDKSRPALQPGRPRPLAAVRDAVALLTASSPTATTTTRSPPTRASTASAPRAWCVEEPRYTADYLDPAKRSIANAVARRVRRRYRRPSASRSSIRSAIRAGAPRRCPLLRAKLEREPRAPCTARVAPPSSSSCCSTNATCRTLRADDLLSAARRGRRAHTRVSRRLLFALLAMTTAQAAVYVARPMTSYRLLGLGEGARAVGLVTAAFALLPLFLAIPLGRFADRRGGPLLGAGCARPGPRMRPARRREDAAHARGGERGARPRPPRACARGAGGDRARVARRPPRLALRFPHGGRLARAARRPADRRFHPRPRRGLSRRGDDTRDDRCGRDRGARNGMLRSWLRGVASHRPRGRLPAGAGACGRSSRRAGFPQASSRASPCSRPPTSSRRTCPCSASSAASAPARSESFWRCAPRRRWSRASGSGRSSGCIGRARLITVSAASAAAALAAMTATDDVGALAVLCVLAGVGSRLRAAALDDARRAARPGERPRDRPRRAADGEPARPGRRRRRSRESSRGAPAPARSSGSRARCCSPPRSRSNGRRRLRRPRRSKPRSRRSSSVSTGRSRGAPLDYASDCSNRSRLSVQPASCSARRASVSNAP